MSDVNLQAVRLQYVEMQVVPNGFKKQWWYTLSEHFIRHLLDFITQMPQCAVVCVGQIVSLDSSLVSSTDGLAPSV